MAGTPINSVLLKHTVAIANGAAISSEVDLGGYRTGLVLIPSAWTGADLTCVAAPYRTVTAGGEHDEKPAPTFNKVRTAAGAISRITNIVTNEAAWYKIPDEWMALGAVKFKSTNTASEADVNQGAARTLKILLKA